MDLLSRNRLDRILIPFIRHHTCLKMILGHGDLFSGPHPESRMMFILDTNDVKSKFFILPTLDEPLPFYLATSLKLMISKTGKTLR